MKPIKTLRFGAERGDFDYLYGEYKSLEEAKKSLKWEASLGQQFIVVNEDKEMDLYLWQGRDIEPLLVTSDEDEDVSGNFNPNGENEVGEDFSIFYNSGTEWKIENSDLEDLELYGDTINSLNLNTRYCNISLRDSGLTFQNVPYTIYSPYSYITNEGLTVRYVDNNITTLYSIDGIGWEAMGSINYLKPPREGSGGFATTSVNDVFADERGNIQLTPETLIFILEEATESEKTQIKSLLGIS